MIIDMIGLKSIISVFVFYLSLLDFLYPFFPVILLVNNLMILLFLLYQLISYTLYCSSFLFWLSWVFTATRGLSLVGVSRRSSLLRCTGFSLWWLFLQHTGPKCGVGHCGALGLVASQGMESSQTRDQLMCHALAGGFLTTGPPGKSSIIILDVASGFIVCICNLYIYVCVCVF